MAAAQTGAGAAPFSVGVGRLMDMSLIRVGTNTAPPIAVSGSTEKKTQCQLSRWVTHAAAGGPKNAGSTHAVEI